MEKQIFGESNFSYEMKFVETNAFQKLLKLTKSGRSPILMTGPGGSGKTSNLHLLLTHLREESRVGILIQSGSIRGETDLLNEIRDQLDESVRNNLGSVQIGSSASIASGIVTELVNSLPSPPVMIFDEIDDFIVRENSAIRIVIGQIQRDTRATLILSGRAIPSWFTSELSRAYEVQLESFDQAEIAEMLVRNEVSKDRIHSLPLLKRVTGGNPLIIALILNLMRSNQFSLEEILEFHDVTPSRVTDRLIEVDLQRFEKLGAMGPSREDYTDLLGLICLREMLAVSELTFSEKVLDQILVNSSLLTRDGSFIRLVHKSMAEAIRASLGLNPPPDLKVSDLSFGMEEAERDNLLEDSFLLPKGMAEIISGETSIVVGDRGSGKSALYAQLTKVDLKPEQKTKIIAMRDPRGLIEKMGTDGAKLDSTEEFREAWRLCVAVTIAESEDISGSLFHSVTAKALRQTFSEDRAEYENWWTPLLNIFRSTKYKFSLGPVSIDAEPLNGKKAGGKRISVDGFLDSVTAQLSKDSVKLILAVDRVDEIHKYDRSRQERLVQGLFQAEAEMSQNSKISLLVFIRSDLFHVYSIEEKNKTISRKFNLEWDEHRLLDVMLHRVFSSEILSDLSKSILSAGGFESIGLQVAFPDTVENVPFVDWLWSSLRNGRGKISPRQIILLLILCKQTSEARIEKVDKLPLISSGILRSAMTKLSEISFEEMTDDFRVAPNFLRNCRAAKLEKLSTLEIDELFVEADGNKNLCIEHLESLGFFERVVREESNGTRSYHFRIPKLFTRAWGEDVD